MKKIVLLFLMSLSFFTGRAQDIEYRLADAIRNGDMIALRQAYLEEGDSVQTPFLKPFSEYLIAHSYHQTETAVRTGNYLLEKYHAELIETGVLASVVRFMADDFTLLGDYESAACILEDYSEFYRKSGYVLFENSEDLAHLYRVLSELGGFKIEKPQNAVVVPLRYDSIPLIYADVQVKDQSVETLISTSSSVNVLSGALAKRLGARMVFAEASEAGPGASSSSTFAVVDSLWLGEVLYRNVPFCVVDMATGDEEADSVASALQCVISNSMLVGLGEIQFDWAHREMIIPHQLSPAPSYAPNLCRSIHSTLVCPVYDYTTQKDIVATVDTGSGMNILTYSYFDSNRESYPNIAPNDSLRFVDFQGIANVPVFTTSLKIRVGDKVKELKEVSMECEYGRFTVNTGFAMGTPALFQFDKVILNFKDMWIKME